jgi:hypothetical protein
LTGFGDRARRGGWRLGVVSGSAVLVLLLALELVSLVTGTGTLYFASIVAAWLILPAIVGLRNVLDAGCYFMLISLGILVVVDLALHGRIPLLA